MKKKLYTKRELLLDELKKIDSTINKMENSLEDEIYTTSDLNMTYKNVNYYKEVGIIEKTKKGWSRFSLLDVYWINLMVKMIGLKYYPIQIVKGAGINNARAKFNQAVKDIIKDKEPRNILFGQNECEIIKMGEINYLQNMDHVCITLIDIIKLNAN